MFLLLFLLYAIISPFVLYLCLKAIYQKKDKHGWHFLYLAKYFITLSFLPLLYFSHLNLAIFPKSPVSIFFLVLTVALSILGIKPAVKKKDLHFYLGGVFAAFMEETLFRGILFGLAQNIWNNTIISIAATSAVFGFWHLKNYALHKNKKRTIRQVLYTGFVYGTIFAVLRIFTGDIYMAVLVHFLNDTYVALAPKSLRGMIIENVEEDS